MKRLLGKFHSARCHHGVEELHLSGHEVVRICGENEQGVGVEVHSGSVWITAEGDSYDYLLSTGPRYRLRGKNIVLEALGESDVTLVA